MQNKNMLNSTVDGKNAEQWLKCIHGESGQMNKLPLELGLSNVRFSELKDRF